MTVSAGCISRLASLYGLVTRMHSLTPSRTSRWRASTDPVLPVMAMAVRVGPGSGCGVRSRTLIVSITRAICSGEAPASITTSMGVCGPWSGATGVGYKVWGDGPHTLYVKPYLSDDMDE